MSDFNEVEEKYQGPFLQCLSDYRVADGLQYSPKEIEQWQARGAVGYKICEDLVTPQTVDWAKTY